MIVSNCYSAFFPEDALNPAQAIHYPIINFLLFLKVNRVYSEAKKLKFTKANYIRILTVPQVIFNKIFEIGFITNFR